MNTLIEKAAKICGTTPEDVLSKSRKSENVTARRFVMLELIRCESIKGVASLLNTSYYTVRDGLEKIRHDVKHSTCIKAKYQLFLKSISYEQSQKNTSKYPRVLVPDGRVWRLQGIR